VKNHENVFIFVLEFVSGQNSLLMCTRENRIMNWMLVSIQSTSRFNMN